jgi:hypothetical protein
MCIVYLIIILINEEPNEHKILPHFYDFYPGIRNDVVDETGEPPTTYGIPNYTLCLMIAE